MYLDRRMFLAASSAVLMAPKLTGTAEAKRKGFFKRINRPIGLQLYTLGDEPEKDLDGTFAKVAAIGYRDIELPGLYGREASAIKAAADRAGLTLSCLHLNAVTLFGGKGPSLSDDPAKIIDLLGTLGIRQVVKPLMLIPDGFAPTSMATFPADLAKALSAAGADIWKRTADLLNEKAALLKPQGISLGYHNHNDHRLGDSGEANRSVIDQFRGRYRLARRCRDRSGCFPETSFGPGPPDSCEGRPRHDKSQFLAFNGPLRNRFRQTRLGANPARRAQGWCPAFLCRTGSAVCHAAHGCRCQISCVFVETRSLAGFGTLFAARFAG
jgi:Xylose isomerase-like TIM barrel